MNILKTALCLAIIGLFGIGCNSDKLEFQTGDILFQSLKSPQCEAIKIATGSQYSHCGLINIIDGRVMVLEGLQPCRLTPVKDWINRGIDKHYVVKRLKNSGNIFSQTDEKQLSEIRNHYLGKNYDIYFGWSDSLIYCSELVWKVYKETWNIELCPLRQLKEFDLSHPVVQAIVKERYGGNIPLNEPVVAPSDIFDSDLLVKIDI
ncbi:MAG: YiiX family permuted papain-like enzyme [Candidatus Zixiibacteriota bacterium]